MIILILEDDMNYATLVAKALEGLAEPAVIAQSWEEAEAYLATHAESPDVAWIDLRMPPNVTVEISETRIMALRASHPNLVVIVASGYLEPMLRYRLMEAGVDGCLYKGNKFEPAQIASLIVVGLMKASRSGKNVRQQVLDRALEWLHARFPETTLGTSIAAESSIHK